MLALIVIFVYYINISNRKVAIHKTTRSKSMDNKNNENLINQLGNEILKMIERYNGKLPPYEIGHQLISNGTSMLIYTAPNELVGVKTAIACVECGINSYEENHS